MKIAVSDFDNTLYFHKNAVENKKEILPQINLDAIKKWRNAGNIFCFCSGRDMRSLMDEVNRYDFGYDYVICNNGATVFDKNLNLLKSFLLDKSALKEILYSDIAKHSWHLLFSAADKMSVVIQNSTSPILQYFESPKYKNQDIINKTSIKEAMENVDSVQLSCAYDNEFTAKKFLLKVEKDFSNIFSAHRNLNYLDICDFNVNKANGIKFLSDLNNWDITQIITVGDSQNDIPMLKEFKGFSLHSATDDAKKYADKLYNSVGEMLLDNL